MMDEIRCLLEEMADAGIRLWVEDGKLKFRAPSGAMTVERANLIKLSLIHISEPTRH